MVTFAVHVSVSPAASVAVSVTVTVVPVSVQSKVLGDTLSVIPVQLSVEPPSTSSPVMVRFPLASTEAVMS